MLFTTSTSHAGACRRWIFLAFRCRSPLHLPCVQVQSNLEGISTPFALPQPPLHAKASRRWISLAFRCRLPHLHLPRMQKRARGGFILTPYVLYLPRMQERAGCRFLWCFDTFCASSASLVCQSELGRCKFIAFLRCSRIFHLPCTQEWARGGLLIVF